MDQGKFVSTTASAALSSEWEQWIVSNIERGVPLSSLIEEMVRKNFDLAAATNAVITRAPDSMLANNAQLSTGTLPAYKYPIPAGFEAHYDYRYASNRIASGNSINIDGHAVRVAVRLGEPEVVVFENLLSDAECDRLIELSLPKLKPSTIVESQTGVEQVIGERTSEGMFFQRGENELVSALETRVAKLMNMPVANGEGIQILHYMKGAEYRPHYDFFAPENPGSAVHLRQGGQRVATLVMYLNDVESGGETIFPEIDFAVAPRKGGAVFFAYCDDANKLDRLTLHGGAPVERGEKWIATKWVRQRAY